MSISLIPAAGRGVRMASDIPKPLLEVTLADGRRASMIEHAMSGMRWSTHRVVATTTPLVDRVQALANPLGYTVIDVGEETAGQADTLARAMQAIPLDEDTRVLISNCDNLFDRHISELLNTGRGEWSAFVHVSSDPRYSYVDSFTRPTRAVEKEVISHWALSGAWGFRSAAGLTRALVRTMLHTPPAANGEWYLSQALEAVGVGHCIPLKASEITDLGTREALERAGAGRDAEGPTPTPSPTPA
jgi:hypothetical protein